MRAPIFKTLRRSPFEGLLEHAKKVKECVHKLKESVECYCDGKYDEFERLSKDVIKLENDADWIKGNITAHLPRRIFMSVDKGDFLTCLHEQDDILDFAEDAVIWLGFRKTEMHQEIKDLFLKHLYKVIETVEILEDVVDNVKHLVVSVTREERNKAKESLKSIHYKEWEADQIEHELGRKIFGLGGELFPAYHLLQAVFVIAHIADHAENAGAKIRAMMAR